MKFWSLNLEFRFYKRAVGRRLWKVSALWLTRGWQMLLSQICIPSWAAGLKGKCRVNERRGRIFHINALSQYFVRIKSVFSLHHREKSQNLQNLTSNLCLLNWQIMKRGRKPLYRLPLFQQSWNLQGKRHVHVWKKQPAQWGPDTRLRVGSSILAALQQRSGFRLFERILWEAYGTKEHLIKDECFPGSPAQRSIPCGAQMLPLRKMKQKWVLSVDWFILQLFSFSSLAWGE